MHYVEIMVADTSYHGNEALTYSSETRLLKGALVAVTVRRKKVMGVVVGATSRPSFTVKPIDAAIDVPPLPAGLLSLLSWLQVYYPAPLGLLTQLILPRALPAKPLPIKELPKPVSKDLPKLTSDQEQAVKELSDPGLHILHGETGSGKTRTYIELARQALAKGLSSIILTPEIGLTSQLANDFKELFGERVMVVHSKLGEATKQRIWRYCLEATEPLIIIGPRSALFYPLRSVGLIVLDEAHETAYKQDQAPYYRTSIVAAQLATYYGATLVLGSATPLISDYYLAKAKQRPIVRLTQLATTTDDSKKTIDLVDLRNRTLFSKSPFISDQLLAAIKDGLSSHEQSLLFLNRRGTARVIFCENCGWQAECPHCDLPMVYHGDMHQMRCHSCGLKAAVPSSCPECRHSDIIFKTIGTKAVAEEIARILPEAKVMRFDTDNKKGERIEEQYQAVRQGDVDILVGTQTLAKGLDLPKLSTVGVILADTGLYFPDFSAQERTYQLLSQVFGRVGRGHRKGHIVVQTYNPDSPLLAAAMASDWTSFYQSELKEREGFLFPPFCYLLKLTCKRASSGAASKAAHDLADTLRQSHKHILIEGPAPSFQEKAMGKFGWQLIIKAKDRRKLIEVIQALPSGWSYDIDPMNLL